MLAYMLFFLQWAAMATDDKHHHKLTHYGTLSFQGFGPETIKSAPVSDTVMNVHDTF